MSTDRALRDRGGQELARPLGRLLADGRDAGRSGGRGRQGQGGESGARRIAASLEEAALGNDDHVALAHRDHRLDGAAALDGLEVEEIEPLLAGRGIGAAQLDALGGGEAVEPAGERDGLQERGAGLDLELARVADLADDVDREGLASSVTAVTETKTLGRTAKFEASRSAMCASTESTVRPAAWIEPASGTEIRPSGSTRAGRFSVSSSSTVMASWSPGWIR